MSEPITTYNGRVIMFNNGVVDVVQGETSLVDENKVAHIPEGGNIEIDNLTIIKNADQELEVPFDNNTIYRDQDGFIKARTGGGSSYTAGDGIQISNDEISVKKDEFLRRVPSVPYIEKTITLSSITQFNTLYQGEDTSDDANEFAKWFNQYSYDITSCHVEGFFGYGGAQQYTLQCMNDPRGQAWQRGLGYTTGTYGESTCNFFMYPTNNGYDEHGEDKYKWVWYYINSDYEEFPLDFSSIIVSHDSITKWDAPNMDIGILFKDSYAVKPMTFKGRQYESTASGSVVYNDTETNYGTIVRELNVNTDNTTLEVDENNYEQKFVKIKDGVLPKYGVERSHPGHVHGAVLSSGITWSGQGSSSGDVHVDFNVPWANFSGYSQFMVVVEDHGNNNTWSGLCSVTEDNSEIKLYGQLTGSSPTIYTEQSGPLFRIYKTQGQLEEECRFSMSESESYSSVGVGETIITFYGVAPEKKYIDLGSQLGTGWEQDREYTVKFKNGKLYLS